MHYALPALMTCLSLLVYFWMSFNVGRARGKYGISAPATTGDPNFERVFRVHYNTMESLVMYLPALWLFALYVSETWAAALGAAWIAGRILYAIAYYSDAKKRGPGMAISTGATLFLLMGALIGAAVALTR